MPKIIKVAITTKDNPFDPIDQFDEWYAFDEQQGYHTSSYLGRMAKTSPSLSDSVNLRIINEAIDDMIEFDLYGNYKKVTKTVEIPDTVEV